MPESVNIGDPFKYKTTSFLILGVILMISSMYINTLADKNAGEIGLIYSQFIVGITIVFQIIFWLPFAKRKLKSIFE